MILKRLNEKTTINFNADCCKQQCALGDYISPEVRKELSNGSSVGAAAAVGKRIAEKAKIISISKDGFDRSGFKYHGRVRALADAAREHGLIFQLRTING